MVYILSGCPRLGGNKSLKAWRLGSWKAGKQKKLESFKAWRLGSCKA
jgi:hypothetical protein